MNKFTVFTQLFNSCGVNLPAISLFRGPTLQDIIEWPRAGYCSANSMRGIAAGVVNFILKALQVQSGLLNQSDEFTKLWKLIKAKK